MTLEPERDAVALLLAELDADRDGAHVLLESYAAFVSEDGKDLVKLLRELVVTGLALAGSFGDEPEIRELLQLRAERLALHVPGS